MEFLGEKNESEQGNNVLAVLRVLGILLDKNVVPVAEILCNVI